MARVQSDATKPLIHLARIQAQKGREAELARRLAEVTVASRAEAGCLLYEWHREVGSKEGAGDPTVFHSYEVWASQAALDAHLETPHFNRFFGQEREDPVLARPPVDYTLERVAPGALPLPRPQDTALQHHTAQTPRGRLHYVTAGQGEVLLLIHGFPQTWYEWRAVIPALAEHFTVIAVDLPGFGDSSAPSSGGVDAVSVAGDLHHLMEQLGHRRVHLMGHDIGNLVAYAYAATYRESVGRLVALEAVLPGAGVEALMAPTPERNLWHFSFHMSGPIAEALVEGKERLYVEHFLREFAYDPSVFSEEDVAEYTRGLSKPGAKRAAFRYFGEMFKDAEDNRRLMQQKLSQPVLALGGDKSLGPFGTASYQQVAQDVRGGAIADCGHWIPEERPAELVREVLGFFGVQ